MWLGRTGERKSFSNVTRDGAELLLLVYLLLHGNATEPNFKMLKLYALNGGFKYEESCILYLNVNL